MKNNFLGFLILFIFFNLNVSANQFIFETKEIEIVDSGNIIYAKDGTAKSSDGLLKIIAQNFEYNKTLDVLKAMNGVAFIESNNLEIEFNKAIFNQNNLTISINGDVKIIERKKKSSYRDRNCQL